MIQDGQLLNYIGGTSQGSKAGWRIRAGKTSKPSMRC